MPPVGWLAGRRRTKVARSASLEASLPVPLLYAATVIVWGLSWYAMEMQLVLPGELAIVYRFLLATAILLAFCAATRRSLRFRARDHLFMALQGLLLFCLNYVLFYWAAADLV